MSSDFKIHSMSNKQSGLKKYTQIVTGTESLWFLIKFELIMFVSTVPGAIGLFLRSKLYPMILGEVGGGVVFGKNITFRHPQKIRIGDNSIVDDNVVLDAKGSNNKGLVIGKKCYIGRNTIVYTKNGDIYLGDRTNIGHNCILFSSNLLELKQKVLVAAYTYIMSGGSYDYKIKTAFVEQDGFSKGITKIGENVWIGAKVVVGDGVQIGANAVIGAGSVVVKNVKDSTVVAGVPGKEIRKIYEE